MIHARSMDIEGFVAAICVSDINIQKNDYAGNSPIHFLMAAGVEGSYLSNLVYRHDTASTTQNVFGQNPLHVLDPQDLGKDLIAFLEWFKLQKSPPGILLTQRDIYGRTPLHTLLQHPLPRSQYSDILRVFPYALHLLQSFDTAGHSCIQLMNRASLKLRSQSESDYELIQNGIIDITVLLAESREGGSEKYGFNDIARGARGNSFFDFFECRICNQTNCHSNSSVDQMRCACAYGRDRNAPDATGLTPAHAIITKERSSPGGEHETPEETAELFRILIPPNELDLREALHVLDPYGQTLIHNIAVRGLDGILKYVLDLETRARRIAMVNSCSKSADGTEKSVLVCVLEKTMELNERIYLNGYTGDRGMRELLVNTRNRLLRCEHILLSAGAQKYPNAKMRWRINS